MVMGFIALKDQGIIGFVGLFFEVMNNPDVMGLKGPRIRSCVVQCNLLFSNNLFKMKNFVSQHFFHISFILTKNFNS